METFKYYLLFFQLACILVDLNTTFFAQPIVLFPIAAGYFNGVLYTVFDLAPNTIMMYFTYFLASQLEVLTLCFIRKYKSIMQLPGGTKYPNWAYYCTYLILTIVPTGMTSSLGVCNEKREVQLQYIRENYPTYAPEFEKLRGFQFYRMNTAFVVFFVFLFVGVAKAMGIVGFVVIHMYTVLKRLSSTLSRKTLAKHKTALNSLIAQYMVTPIVMIPAAIMAVAILIPMEHSQVVSQYCMTLTTTHSTINAIVVILTNPDFRKAVIFWKKPSGKTSVVVSRF